MYRNFKLISILGGGGRGEGEGNQSSLECSPVSLDL